MDGPTSKSPLDLETPVWLSPPVRIRCHGDESLGASIAMLSPGETVADFFWRAAHSKIKKRTMHAITKCGYHHGKRLVTS